ncbi:hypothetical protein V6N13_033674 [Hibiscus sabdariffa]|uniref:Uncharacterized protein n=1 Tax=Hibiscus sabdariffa TaxID=183260 RepID=A0ABR2F9T5_9ROSI
MSWLICDRLLRRDVSANTALLICVLHKKYCVHQQQHRRYVSTGWNASANNSFSDTHPRDGMLPPTTASQMEYVRQQCFADRGSQSNIRNKSTKFLDLPLDPLISS